MEVLYSCIVTPIIVGWEDMLQVGSLLPVNQHSISNEHTPNTRICIRNCGISFRVIMAQFWRSLLGWDSMSKEPQNDTSVDSCLVLASKTIYVIGKNNRKKNVRNIYIYTFYVILWFVIEKLTLAIYIYRLHLLKFWEGLVDLSPNVPCDLLVQKIARYTYC